MSLRIQTQTQQRSELVVTLSADDSAFAGHFPGLPIVPGVIQLQWAMENSARWYSQQAFLRADKLKFQQVIVPGDPLLLTLSHLGEGKVAFSYQSDGQQLSSGVLVFRVE